MVYVGWKHLDIFFIPDFLIVMTDKYKESAFDSNRAPFFLF